MEREDDAAALVRAGRLSVERVALAAWLGDERALATGVKPWTPPAPPGAAPAPKERMALLLRQAPLDLRQRVALLCPGVAEVVADEQFEQLDPQAPAARVVELAASGLSAVQAWCRGEAERVEMIERFQAAQAAYTDFHEGWHEGVHGVREFTMLPVPICADLTHWAPKRPILLRSWAATWPLLAAAITRQGEARAVGLLLESLGGCAEGGGAVAARRLLDPAWGLWSG